MRHGWGRCVYPNGHLYVGAWWQGKEHGLGVLCDKDDAPLFEGEFVDGRIQGRGTFYFRNGDIYEGELRDGLFQGNGTITTSKGASYCGEWKDGARHGRGR